MGPTWMQERVLDSSTCELGIELNLLHLNHLSLLFKRLLKFQPSEILIFFIVFKKEKESFIIIL